MSSGEAKNGGITRKDFLHGLALATSLSNVSPSGASAQALPANPDGTNQTYFQSLGIGQDDPRYYPPALTRMRGSHPGSYPTGHALRDGAGWVHETPADTDEVYDLVIVGGGISGLSCAHFYRKQRPDARILILENHDDFGGHAKRNEFTTPGGRLLLGYGGTQNLENVRGYSPVALGLLKDIGVEPKRFYDFYDRGFRGRHGLASAVFFDRETFGRDQLLPDPSVPIDPAVGFEVDPTKYAAFLARSPLSARAQQDLIALQTQPKDYLPGLSLEEKRKLLLHTSFADFLMRYVKVDPDVVKYFQKRTHGGFGMGIDAVDCEIGGRMLAPKLMAAMGFPERPRGAEREPYIFHFPDGNASVARLLVRSLIPGAAAGDTMEDIVTAKVNYPALDRPEHAVRIRMNSTAVCARNLPAGGTEVIYMRQGKAYRVRSPRTILACWHMIIPYMCPELPEKQKAAMHACVKIPIIYGSIQISNWQALKKLGVGSTYCPGSYFSEVNMDFPVSMGDYRYTSDPDQSCVIHLVRTPCSPGLSARDQHRIGRADIYATPFETFEHHVRDQLGRMYGPGGFDANRDILAITINRWPHGYTYFPMPLWDGDLPEDQQIHVVSRAPLGNIHIANTDAGGDAETNLAIDQAHRATNEALA